MSDDELEELLDSLEAGFREDVQAALTLTAREFAAAVDRSTELTAAAFSVSRIRDMWRRRVPALLNSLRVIVRRGARAAAGEVDESVPSNRDMSATLAPYLVATEALLDQVGDRLATDAVQTLAEGVAAGDSLEQLKRRMTDVFSRTGSELGPTRAERIAATESTRAFNAGALAAARALTGPERPLVKQWVTRHDERVRMAHRDADGQLQLLDEPFDVGGTGMQYPGDPTAPADLTINCRCIMKVATAPTPERTASMGSEDSEEFQSRMPEQLKQYWLVGEGAAKVRWGTPGSFERCVRNLRDDFPQNPEGLCANLYHEATGRWPGQDRNKGAVEHTGAMIALIPAVHDAGYMSVPDGEPVEELHVTLAYLGEADAWDPDVRAALLEAMSQVASGATPVSARAFGVAHWNPDSDSPAWVYSLSDDGEANSQTLTDVHSGVMRQLYDFAQARDLVPVQHSPWVAHMTGIYDSNDRREEMSAKLGPVTFDRLRVAFAGDHVDFPLGPEACDGYEDLAEETVVDIPKSLPWSTPGDAALAFENEQTGDGRVFAPGALYWDGSGPWPLQYADEMQGGHDGAELAGEINSLGRDGNRIPGSGKLYLTLAAGVEAAMLLDQHSPLGVSVDLDDVDLEMVDTQPGSGGTYRAKLLNASVLPAASGGYHLVGQTVPTMAASGLSMVTESRTVSFIIPADGMVPGEAIDLVAAAGDPDFTDGTVVDSTRSGQYLMRITRARVRGATLVSIPAFANARIVLDEQSPFNQPSGPVDEATAAIQSVTDYDRVLRHVRRSSVPVGAARLAQALKMPVVAAQRMLATAASRGEVVRLTRGLYTDKTTSAKADHVMLDDMVASVTGQVDLPVADRDTEWDGAGAADRVFTWADGDASKIGRAFAYRDDDKDPLTKAAYKLGYADVLDGQLTIVPKGVSAALGALNGARGGVDLPADERAAVRERLDSVAAHVDEVTGEDMAEEMHASAWAALKDAPAFRAEWFREPTIEELPPGGPGVNYADGRIFGWVAQAGEAHAGFAKKVTIDGLGRIDTTHFLRQRFTLDDGSTVKAGAYTMNVGHHRDGAECETSSCQFDDTRTVAGIVTVGMNERGMWFSGAAAPWLSEWDRAVFQATQPSYHMKKAPGGGWQLRAVLAVPVPGHSSPLLASAVVGRAQMALTAAATLAEANDAVVAEQAFRDAAEKDTQGIDYDRLADSLVAAFARAEQRKADEAAELAELLAMADTLDVDITGTEGN